MFLSTLSFLIQSPKSKSSLLLSDLHSFQERHTDSYLLQETPKVISLVRRGLFLEAVLCMVPLNAKGVWKSFRKIKSKTFALALYTGEGVNQEFSFPYSGLLVGHPVL